MLAAGTAPASSSRTPTRAARSQRLTDFCEVAVATEAALETGRSGDAVLDQRLAAVVPFLDQRLAHAESMASDRRASVGTHADLRKARDLLRQFLRLRAGPALRGDIFAQADA